MHDLAQFLKVRDAEQHRELILAGALKRLNSLSQLGPSSEGLRDAREGWHLCGLGLEVSRSVTRVL